MTVMIDRLITQLALIVQSKAGKLRDIQLVGGWGCVEVAEDGYIRATTTDV